MEDMQPGQVIMPNPPSGTPQPSVGAPVPERPEERGDTPLPQPQPDPGVTQANPASIQPPQYAPVEQTAVAPMQPNTTQSFYMQNGSQPQSDWQYHQDAVQPATMSPQAMEQGLSWTAAEFVAHSKSFMWYLALAGVACLLAAFVYLLTHDVFSAGVILFVLVIFGIYAARRPRMLQYGLDAVGIHVGVKTYNFQDFKTFSVTEEGSIASIILMPLKRFMPPLTIYVAPESEEAVITMLSQYLPFEVHKADAIDSLLRRIHF